MSFTSSVGQEFIILCINLKNYNIENQYLVILHLYYTTNHESISREQL